MCIYEEKLNKKNSMTLQEAYNFFESIKKEATKKNEIKVYEKFLYILSKLQSRELSKEEIISLEMELENLNLKSNPEKRKKYFKKALSSFEKYLRNTLSLISKGYYTELYMGLGMSYGLLFGLTFLFSLERSLGLSLGLIVGMSIGLIIGRNMDSKAVAEGRVL